jgi:hypothetical protein
MRTRISHRFNVFENREIRRKLGLRSGRVLEKTI